MFPLTGPADFGAKRAVKVMLWPGARLMGTVSPLMLKPVPLTVALEIEIEAQPLFFTLT